MQVAEGEDATTTAAVADGELNQALELYALRLEYLMEIQKVARSMIEAWRVLFSSASIAQKPGMQNRISAWESVLRAATSVSPMDKWVPELAAITSEMIREESGRPERLVPTIAAAQKRDKLE